LDVRAAKIDQRKALIRQQEAEIRSEEELIARERAKLDDAEEVYRGHLNEKTGKVVMLRSPPQAAAETAPRNTADKNSISLPRWTAAIDQIVQSANRGMANDEVKAELRKTPLGDQLNTRTSGRKYYYAIRALDKKGRIVSHNGRLYSREAYSRFQEAVKAGLAEDTPAVAHGHYSPMGEAILEIAGQSAIGLRRYDLIGELNKNPMFAESMAKVGDIYRVPTQSPREATQ
jgi:hypothetical protein